MTNKEYKARKEKSKKCVHCFDFFGIKLCFFYYDENTVQLEPFKIRAPFCVNVKQCPDENINNRKENINMAFNPNKFKGLKQELNNSLSSMAEIIVVLDSDLVDYPYNDEDLTKTADLEKSIEENGFTDILEITDYNMPNGKYMILSGHRRRVAGRKKGMTQFPCKVVHFENELDIERYVLSSNSSRKDTLMWERRFAKWERYFLKRKEEGSFKGSVLDAIAESMGISRKQAERYRATNKLIEPIRQLIIEDKGATTSFAPIATFEEAEQASIYTILLDAMEDGEELSKKVVRMIVDGYKQGVTSWGEIKQAEQKTTLSDSGIPIITVKLGEDNEAEDIHVETDFPNRNDEIIREDDGVISEIFDDIDRDRQEETEDEPKGKGNGAGKRKEILTEEEQALKRGEDILKSLEKLNTSFSDVYSFHDKTKAVEVIKNMSATFEILLDEMYNISREYDSKDAFVKLVTELSDKVEDYK